MKMKPKIFVTVEIEVSNLIRDPKKLLTMSDEEIREIVSDSPEWFDEDAKWTIRRVK